MADFYINIPNSGSPSWKKPVASAALLPATGNTVGDVRVATDTDTIYVWDGSAWLAVATPGAAIAIDGLIGDVLATGPGTVVATVAFVGGQSASSVASGVIAANAATSSNTPNTIVKRDGSGNFSAGTITALLTGNVTGNVSGTAGNITASSNSTLITLSALSLPATQLTGTLQAAQEPAHTGDVTNTAGSLALHLVATSNSTLTTLSALSLPGAQVTGNIAGTASNITATSNSTLTSLPSLVLPTSQLSGTISLTTQVSGVLPIANGGTGSSSQNFVDLTTNQTVGGNKTFTGQTAVSNTSTTAFTVNTTSLVVDATNNAVGIGTAPASTAVLDIVNNSGSTKAIQVTGYGSNVGFRGRYANGTLSSPTSTLSGNTISFFSGRGYGTTGFASAATGVVNIIAGANFTDTSMPTYITLNTTPSASVTSLERIRINSTGNILIGTTTDNNTDLLQFSSTGGLISNYSKLAGSTSGYLNNTVPSTVTTYTLTWPSAQSSAGQFLFNDGAGNLSWSNPLSNIDGGSSNTIYVSAQVISGGTA